MSDGVFLNRTRRGPVPAWIRTRDRWLRHHGCRLPRWPLTSLAELDEARRLYDAAIDCVGRALDQPRKRRLKWVRSLTAELTSFGKAVRLMRQRAEKLPNGEVAEMAFSISDGGIDA